MAQPIELDVETDAAMLSPSNSAASATTSSHEVLSLRLSEIESAHLCPSARAKMEELFRHWLNVDGTKEMIQTLVDDLRQGKDVHIDALLQAANSGHPPGSDHGHSPSRSPKRPPNYHHFGTHSPNRERKKDHMVSLFGNELGYGLEKKAAAAGDAAMGEQDGDLAMEDVASKANSRLIPRFYSPGEGRRGRLRGLSTDSIARKSHDIETRFREFPEGMKVEDFVAITKDLCGFPSFFNAPFFRRILAWQTSTTGTVANEPTGESDAQVQRITKDTFQSYWMSAMAPFDPVERFFRVVKQPQHDYIQREDFEPFLQELLKYHPGLEFLAGTPEFQEKYALTVIVRIFYSVDRDSSGKITLRKLRRSNLIEAFNCVDEEEDINKVNSYFSYEHFYVLYCKFWELDTDHDFQLSQDDLVRYGGHALTRIIVDRIFEHGRRPFARLQSLSWAEKKKMSYEDFIYFMLSEEDKSNPVSIRYWFELIDTNEDDVIRADEMRTFYRHQVHRMECLGHEVVPFEDILCQMSDLLHPAVDGEFMQKDLTREDKIRVSGVFFNVLFNLSKFIEFEQRDPFLLRQQLAEPELTDWDRYARAEYARLAMEEEGRDDDSAMDIDTMDGWYVSDEPDDDIEIMGNESNSSNSGPTAGGSSRTVEAPF